MQNKPLKGWGITCYEVFADGLEPFDTFTNAQCKADILAGKFLQLPTNTPDAVKKYISGMIFVEASRRAAMSEVVFEFEKIVLLETPAGGPKQKNVKVLKPRPKGK
uniref:PK_Tyr_Ser-Thr domain-containing protein n=1 Tax=Caenorhabditis japonica TaxID=281687 RepID=A0A8R1E1G5_CAEJA